MYILVLNFGEKNVKKGGKGGSPPMQKIIGNLRKLTHIYNFLTKKCNEEFQKSGGGGVQGRLEFFQKTSIFANRDVPNF